MDWLLVFVVCAIAVQLCLPLVGAYSNARAQKRAKRRARLLEVAADQQAAKAHKLSATISHRDRGASE